MSAAMTVFIEACPGVSGTISRSPRAGSPRRRCGNSRMHGDPEHLISKTRPLATPQKAGHLPVTIPYDSPLLSSTRQSVNYGTMVGHFLAVDDPAHRGDEED